MDDTNPKDALGLKKAPLRLVPPALKIFVAAVMALGAKKYGGEWNWRTKKTRHSVYLEAAMRHLEDAMDGIDADPESGLPHEAHVAACMGIILDAKEVGSLIDDRPKGGYVSRLLEKFTAKEQEPTPVKRLEQIMEKYPNTDPERAFETILKRQKEQAELRGSSDKLREDAP
jgi:Domain of unknown function (DUF5664)